MEPIYPQILTDSILSSFYFSLVQDFLNKNIIRDVIKQKKKESGVFGGGGSVKEANHSRVIFSTSSLFLSFSLSALRALTRAYNAHLAHTHYTRLLEKSVNTSTNIFGGGVSIIQRIFNAPEENATT